MAWQYCDCGNEINPTDEDILRKYVICTCGLRNYVIALDEVRENLLIEMYRYIQELKNGRN